MENLTVENLNKLTNTEIEDLIISSNENMLKIIEDCLLKLNIQKMSLIEQNIININYLKKINKILVKKIKNNFKENNENINLFLNNLNSKFE